MSRHAQARPASVQGPQRSVLAVPETSETNRSTSRKITRVCYCNWCGEAERLVCRAAGRPAAVPGARRRKTELMSDMIQTLRHEIIIFFITLVTLICLHGYAVKIRLGSERSVDDISTKTLDIPCASRLETTKSIAVIMNESDFTHGRP